MSLLLVVVLESVAILAIVAVIVLSSIDGTSPVHAATKRVHAALLLLLLADFFDLSDGDQVHVLHWLG